MIFEPEGARPQPGPNNGVRGPFSEPLKTLFCDVPQPLYQKKSIGNGWCFLWVATRERCHVGITRRRVVQTHLASRQMHRTSRYERAPCARFSCARSSGITWSAPTATTPATHQPLTSYYSSMLLRSARVATHRKLHPFPIDLF